MNCNWKKTFMTMAMFIGLGATAQAATYLSFEQLKAACQDPARFHNQIAPKNIEISCQETQYRWTPDKAGTVDLSTERQITSAIVSDKYSVAPSTAEVDMADEVAACPQFVRIKETLALNRGVTCAEIVAYAGNGTDFCLGLASEMRAANAKAVQVEVLDDQRISTCGLAEDKGQSQRGQRGQR